VDALSDRVSPVRSVMKELESKFTRQQVKGVLAELINIPAEHRDADTALEITAGGRLYSVGCGHSHRLATKDMAT